MKKLCKVMVLICFFSLLACSRISGNDFTGKYTFTFSKEGIDVIQKEGKDYTISNAIFYNGSFYFTIIESEYNNGKFLANSSIYKANINTKTVLQLFSDNFTSNYEDKIYIKDDMLIYLNQSNSYLNAINLKTLDKLKEFHRPVDATTRLYSPDLNKIFDSYFGGINIQNLSSRQKAFYNNHGDTYSSVNWSKDSSKLVCIAENEHQIYLFDSISMQMNKINAEHYAEILNNDLVDVLQCFVDSKGRIALNFLTEKTTDIILLNRDGNCISKISTDWDSVIYDMNDYYIAYAVKDEIGKMNLLLYDFKSSKSSTIVQNEIFYSATLMKDTIVYTGKRNDGNCIIRKISISRVGS